MSALSIRLIIFYFFTFFFSLIQHPSFSQCVTFEITANGDTLNCEDKNGYKRGKWTNRVESLRGEPGYEEEGLYERNEKTGYWRIFSLQGDLIGIENYIKGQKNGTQQYFNTMGNLIREESWLAYIPEKPTETVNVYDLNPTGNINKVQVKAEGSSIPHGVWKFFDEETGRLLRTDNYLLGKLSTEAEDEKTTKNQADSTGIKPQGNPNKPKEKPKPKEVQDFEKQNDGKKKYKIRTGSTG
jgi:hypothetical protein